MRIIAGAGPLCAGYVLLSPKEHVNTVAELQDPHFWEFSAASEILKYAFLKRYGPGYTAYEHGKIGTCGTLENESCLHAHRVFIPVETSVSHKLETLFNYKRHLTSPELVREYRDTKNVYYETGVSIRDWNSLLFRSELNELPPQFMRRILSKE